VDNGAATRYKWKKNEKTAADSRRTEINHGVSIIVYRVRTYIIQDLLRLSSVLSLVLIALSLVSPSLSRSTKVMCAWWEGDALVQQHGRGGGVRNRDAKKKVIKSILCCVHSFFVSKHTTHWRTVLLLYTHAFLSAQPIRPYQRTLL